MNKTALQQNPYTLAFFRRRFRYSRRCRRAAVISFAIEHSVEHVTAQFHRSRRSERAKRIADIPFLSRGQQVGGRHVEPDSTERALVVLFPRRAVEGQLNH